jgi:hypothetical protein
MCHHMSAVCHFCLQEYMEVKVKAIEYESPCCPRFGCNVRLDLAVIKQFISAETLKK